MGNAYLRNQRLFFYVLKRAQELLNLAYPIGCLIPGAKDSPKLKAFRWL
jgi:hypothetical protein